MPNQERITALNRHRGRESDLGQFIDRKEKAVLYVEKYIHLIPQIPDPENIVHREEITEPSGRRRETITYRDQDGQEQHVSYFLNEHGERREIIRQQFPDGKTSESAVFNQRDNVREFLARPDVLRHIQDIVAKGKQVLLPAFHRYLRAPAEQKSDAFRDLRESYLDLYILVAPVARPDDNPWLQEAEARHNTTSIVRHPDDPKEKVKLWLSMGTMHNVDDHSKTARGHRSVDGSTLSGTESADLMNWHDVHGLLVHTAGAARLYELILKNIQDRIKQKNPAELSSQELKILQAVLEEGILSLLGHDIGRLVTQDSLMHLIVSQIILTEIGLESDYRQDYDLATEFGFQNAEANVDPTNKDEVVQAEGVIPLIWYICDFYSKFIKNEGEMSPELVAALNKEFIDQVKIKWRIRFRGDEKIFLQGGGQFARQNDPSKRQYYSRQVELVNTIFDFLEQDFNIPNHELQHLFKMAEDYMYQFLELKTAKYLASQTEK